MKNLLSSIEQNTMLDGVLFWLNSNMSNFNTPNELNVGDLHSEKISPDITRKAFTELGLVLRFSQRSSRVRNHPEFILLKENWLDNLTKSSFFFDTKRRLQLFPHRTLAYATLDSLGFEQPEVKADLKQVMNRGYMDRVERSAWEKLDMKYYTEMAGLTNQFPSYKELFEDSMLQNMPSLSYVQNFDLYGLTHLIFHFSDFSSKDMKSFLGKKYNEIQSYIDSSLCMCLIDQDWDLVEELLINQYCMRKQFTDLEYDSASAIATIMQPSGFIPGRDWVKAYQETPNFDKSEHTFKDVYHPTILSLFLLTLELND